MLSLTVCLTVLLVAIVIIVTVSKQGRIRDQKFKIDTLADSVDQLNLALDRNSIELS